jgi:CxxC motif-containing protein
MVEIAKIELEAPVKLGDIVIENILDTGVNIVTTREMPKK